MDAIGSFVVAASAPLDIKVWRVDTQPASKPGGEAVTSLSVVRELSIMSVGQPLRVRLLTSLISGNQKTGTLSMRRRFNSREEIKAAILLAVQFCRYEGIAEWALGRGR